MQTKVKRLLGALYFSLWGCVFFTRTAHAYIDPATTSYLFQIVAGLFIACGATVAVFWKRITAWLKSQRLRYQEAQIKKEANRKTTKK